MLICMNVQHNMRYEEYKNKVYLGIFHIIVGLSLLTLWYGLDIELLERITALTNMLPSWSLIIAAFIEATYWVGGIIPGQTYLGLYLLGHECGLDHSALLYFYIWIGVVTGLISSYFLGYSIKGRTITQSSHQEPYMWKSKNMLLAAYPAAAATYLFERGFEGRKMLSALIPLIVSGSIILLFGMTTLCLLKEQLSQYTGGIGFFFASVLIVLGSIRIYQGTKGMKSKDVVDTESL